MRVLVTDGDSRAALAVTRSLGRAGHDIVVGERHTLSLAKSSRYCSEKVVYPDPVSASDAFVDALAQIVRDRRIDVLIPVADVALILATTNRDRFADSCTIPFAGARAIERAADKVDILETASRLGVPVPRSLVVADPERIPSFGFGFPVVIKPRQSRIRTPAGWVSSAVSYAQDPDELRRDLAARPRHEFPLMLQERIVGPGVGVFACYRDGRPVAFFSHRRLRERPPWGGVSVLSESVPASEAALGYATRLLDELAWQGVAMVEFKQDVRDGLPKLMEINGRFWGSLQLAIDAGVDFPALLVEPAQNGPPPYRAGVRNRWFWGDVDSLLVSLFSGHGAPKAVHVDRWRAIVEFAKFRGRDLYYDNPKWSDPWPWFVESYCWFRDIATNALPTVRRRAGLAAPNGDGRAAPSADARVAGASASEPATVPIRARIVAGLDAVGLDEQQWNALAATGDTNSIFQTHEWARSWWRAFGARYRPLLVTATHGATIVGVAPLVVEQDHSERVIKFLGDGRADYCDVLGAASGPVLDAMFEAICADEEWDVIDLKNIPVQSRTVEALEAFCRRAGYPILVEDQFVCPTLLIRGHEESARTILNKASLRRRETHLKRHGRLVCRNLTTAAEIEPYLEPFFAQHMARWDGNRESSLFHNPDVRHFYRELAHTVSGKGWLVFSVIEFNDRPIAFHYGFDYNDSVLWYKPSFDVEYSSKSPGLVLVRHLIDYAVTRQRRELDFTVGDEPFKRRFTNSVRKTIHVQIFKHRVRYMVERSKREMMSAVKRTVATVSGPERAVTR